MAQNSLNYETRPSARRSQGVAALRIIAVVWGFLVCVAFTLGVIVSWMGQEKPDPSLSPLGMWLFTFTRDTALICYWCALILSCFQRTARRWAWAKAVSLAVPLICLSYALVDGLLLTQFQYFQIHLVMWSAVSGPLLALAILMYFERQTQNRIEI